MGPDSLPQPGLEIAPSISKRLIPSTKAGPVPYSLGCLPKGKSSLAHSKTNKELTPMSDKNGKKKTKRLSKGQGTHVQRLKQAAGKELPIAGVKN